MSSKKNVVEEDAFIDPKELQVGMYVHLDLSWLAHPFPQSSFKIRAVEQIAIIRGLGLQRVQWFPRLSEVVATQPAASGDEMKAAPAVVAPSAAAVGVEPAQPAAEGARRLAAERASSQQCQRALNEGARKVKALSRTLHANPAAAREQGQALVTEVVDEMLARSDLVIRVMADTAGNESAYHHALNVSLLSLMLAKVLQLPRPVIELIGLGALFHDIGKFEIPDRIARATGPLTRPETTLLQTHAAKGVDLARKMALLPEALKIIQQHHEHADGTGYPAKLQGSEISLPARIVAVVNAYDNLCNPLDARLALTPHEALALLWGRRRSQFDEKVLGAFVRSMGVYPPGTAVRLSDGRLGMVTTVNSTQPLKPWVMLFDPVGGRDGAPLLDLQGEDSLAIVKALRPADLPPLAREALALGGRVAYHVGSEAARAKG